jgi:hypothetical protein
LTVKTSLIFGKRFTIFKTVNRFPKLSFSSLHACLISDRQNLTIVGRRNPVSAGVRQHPVSGILPAPESGHRLTKFRPKRSGSDWICPDPAIDLAGSGQNGRDPAGYDLIRQDPVKLSCQNPATATRRCRIPATFAKL